MNPSPIELLRRMPLFGGLNESALTLVLNVASPKAIAAGEHLFEEGDRAESLFVLKTGEVAVQKRMGESTITLGQLGPGDCIGEMALIDFQPRSASILAQTDCEVLEVPTLCLRELMTSDLMQYTMIMMNMGREVSRRLRIADERIIELSRRPGSS